jgi:hypothetical protein
MTITYPLTLPTAPGFVRSRWSPQVAVAASESPFTFATQVQDHGGDRWAVELDLAPMPEAQARLWRAFLLSLRGRKGTFLLGNPDYRTLHGAGGGTPVVDGAHSARATVLNVRGLAAVADVWKAGDYIQLGTGATARLHMVLNDVDGTASSPDGAGAVDIFPQLRTALTDGTAITVGPTAQGVFRMAGNVLGWEADALRIHGVSFSAVEALDV